MDFPMLYHPQNTQFGRGAEDGKYELFNPFKTQQIVNTKARRDPKLAIYNLLGFERFRNFARHFRTGSSNPAIHDVYPYEIAWHHYTPEPFATFPEGDIRVKGFTALNGVSPLLNVRPLGVVAGASKGEGMTDFAVTQSGLVSVINNSKYDILTGDYVAAIFPTSDTFTNGQEVDERFPDRRLQPQRTRLQSINPAGLPPEKLMAAIVPINQLLNHDDPDTSVFAASMNGIFHVPTLDGNRCVLPSYARQEFESNPRVFFERFANAENDQAFQRFCFPIDSDIIRTDILHNFGLGRALGPARAGRTFSCLLGTPFRLPRHEWLLRPNNVDEDSSADEAE